MFCVEHELHLDVSDPETEIEVQPPVKVRTTTVAPSTPTPEPIIHVGTTNVTVQLGSTALLHCEIANLSEKTVSPANRQIAKFDSKSEKKKKKTIKRQSNSGGEGSIVLST